jgi:hypothetical protein
MEVYVSIDGVLRNILQKFDYHYRDYFIETDSETKETFEYSVSGPVLNDNVLDSYKFQSNEEFLKFFYFDFPIEIFGHAGLSYNQAVTELNTLIFENPDVKFTLIGLSEKAKAKPATLFFLSRNGVICDNVTFSQIEQIDVLWDKCDLWITDDKRIIESCPKNKKVVKFNTAFNKHFTNTIEINKLLEIKKEWLKFSEKTITSTLMELLINVKQGVLLKMKTALKC